MKRTTLLISSQVLLSGVHGEDRLLEQFIERDRQQSLDDASCNIETVDYANGELSGLLDNLAKTKFFRLFRMDVKAKPVCPYDFERKEFLTEEELDEVEEEAAEAEKSGKTGNDCGSEQPTPTVKKMQQSGVVGLFANTNIGDESKKGALCTLDLGGEKNAMTEEEVEEDTWGSFASSWELDSDLTEDEENAAAEMTRETSKDFWKDLCSDIKCDAVDYINLRKNPEFNTGYNGSHVWEAMYSLNCFSQANEDADRCLEERVLHRLISGIHATTSTSIFRHYYPATVPGEAQKPNEEKFIQNLGRNPSRLKNIYFSFVVMLRAVRKAKDFLWNYNYDFKSDSDEEEDTNVTQLMHQLLSAEELSPCKDLFGAFNESVLFNGISSGLTPLGFKEGFRGIARLMSCVGCARCRLHGKLHILGIGTALKLLLLPQEEITSASVARDDIVALINTIHAFSESLEYANVMIKNYFSKKEQVEQEKNATEESPRAKFSRSLIDLRRTLGIAPVEGATRYQRDLELTPTDELILQDTISKLSVLLANSESSRSKSTPHVASADAVVVGSGLAGMAATLTILERGGNVILVEKERSLGGNSGKASSGINGEMWDDVMLERWSRSVREYNELHDSNVTEEEMLVNTDLADQFLTSTPALSKFYDDTVKSGGGYAVNSRVKTLVLRSNAALRWLQTQDADIGGKAQLGGHSHPRSHRPTQGSFIGAELIFKLENKLRQHEKKGALTILTETKATSLITTRPSSGEGSLAVSGIEVETAESRRLSLHGSVVLTTGGYGHDHTKGDSLLFKHRPDLIGVPTTNGAATTGDGQRLVAALPSTEWMHMEMVQVHPTGFVDPVSEDAGTKTLAAEVLRGVGGFLLNADGKRFCNEVGTRQYVVDAMKEQSVAVPSQKKPFFFMLLSPQALHAAGRVITHYFRKGLFHNISLRELIANKRTDGNLPAYISDIPSQTLLNMKASVEEYISVSTEPRDRFGKTRFPNAPLSADDTIAIARVTPVVHYTMGGVMVDDVGRVVQNGRNTSVPIEGLYAAGEITGGLHGGNRLAGNSLCECAVFGRLAGQQVPIRSADSSYADALSTAIETLTHTQEQRREQSPITSVALENFTLDAIEAARTESPARCLLALYGDVYDLTAYAAIHPGGEHSITELCGQDATEAFEVIHTQNMITDGGFVSIGKLIEDHTGEESSEDSEESGECHEVCAVS